MKTKEILVSTLEKRFYKLSIAASYAEDCANAVSFLAQRLKSFEITAAQGDAADIVTKAINLWNKKFSTLKERLQIVENKYYEHLSEDNMKCELIEEVPTYDKGMIPNLFYIEELFNRIGYYRNGNASVCPQYNIYYTTESLLSSIKDFRLIIVLCIKVLGNAVYKGVWKDVESIAYDLNEFEPRIEIDYLLKLFGEKDYQLEY